MRRCAVSHRLTFRGKVHHKVHKALLGQKRTRKQPVCEQECISYIKATAKQLANTRQVTAVKQARANLYGSLCLLSFRRQPVFLPISSIAFYKPGGTFRFQATQVIMAVHTGL